MFYCGIDIAKYKHEASVIDINGKALIDSNAETSGDRWTSSENCDIIRFADGGYIMKKGWSENGSEKYPRRKRAV